jgi:hypothetical protein
MRHVGKLNPLLLLGAGRSCLSLPEATTNDPLRHNGGELISIIPIDGGPGASAR